MRVYVDNVMRGCYSEQCKHDEAFNRTAHKVCDVINEGKREYNIGGIFKFGNAQKLINMTIKYLYISCYVNGSLRENFKCCHCPMDSIMLDYVWEEYGKAKGKRIREIKLNEGIKNGEFKAGWGQEKWTDEKLPRRYRNFQVAVRELIASMELQGKELYPLEYDYYLW